MSHADFRPKRRAGVVPSGRPRRKIPLLRILLLIGVAIFVYAKFDDYWPSLRGALNPVAAWNRLTGRESAALPAAPSRAAWSDDSTRVALSCPSGLGENDACCDAPADARSLRALCAQAGALLARARWGGMLAPGAEKEALRLEGRATLSEEGFPSYELSGLRGNDGSGAFAFQRGDAATWCEARRGCLSTPSPRSPLAGGRLVRGPGGPEEKTAEWIAAASAVHPSLPGRVTGIEPVQGGARVRVYHGRELYTSYEPVRLAEGSAALKVGAKVTAGTVLGTAPGGPKGYTLLMRIRRAGLSPDPFDFFSLRAPQETDPLLDSTAAATDSASAG